MKHGLFTYALLRGMRARSDEGAQGGHVAGLPADADFNRDGIVSTDELDAYARQVLPLLSSVFDRARTRRGGSDAVAARDASGRGDSIPPAQLQATSPLPRLQADRGVISHCICAEQVTAQPSSDDQGTRSSALPRPGEEGAPRSPGSGCSNPPAVDAQLRLRPRSGRPS